MKSLLFFSFIISIFLLTSISIAPAPAAAAGASTPNPPDISSQSLSIVLIYNNTPSLDTSLWSWSETTGSPSVYNVTPGVMDSGGTSIFQSPHAGPGYYSFSYQWNLLYFGTADYAAVANLTNPSGSNSASWGYPVPSFGYSVGNLNFNYGQSLYNQTLTVFLVNVSAHPYQYFPEFTIHFTEQHINVNVYHNSTVVQKVPEPYIPLLVYVIIAVLFASTIAFGIQGHEEEDKVNRTKRRGF